MSKEAIAEIIESALRKSAQARDEKPTALQNEAAGEQLKEWFSVYGEKHTFHPGQLLTIKPGIPSPYKLIEHGTPVVYVRAVTNEDRSSRDHGDNFLSEDFIGGKHIHGKFVMFTFDAGFFQPL